MRVWGNRRTARQSNSGGNSTSSKHDAEGRRIPPAGNRRSISSAAKTNWQFLTQREDSKTHSVSLVAWGGVGKTSLVKHWLGQMARHEYRGAQFLFGWSFYRGTSDKAASADDFINAALRFFGDADPTAGSAWDRGEQPGTTCGHSVTCRDL